MVILNKVSSVIALMVVVGMLFFDNNNLAVHGQCQGDIRGLITYCTPFVRKGLPPADPSPPCCKAVSSTDVGCACQRIPPEVERMLDMAKVVHVAAFCGKPLAHGSKCGSYTVP